MQIVCTRFGHDVDGRATGSAQVGRVIAPVDLEFLHCVLAQGQTHAAGIVVGLAAVNCDTVASAIASVKRKPALRSLLYAEICIISNGVGIAHARHKQCKGQIVAAIDRQIFYVLLCDRIGLAASFGLDHGRHRGDLDGLCRGGYFQVEI